MTPRPDDQDVDDLVRRFADEAQAWARLMTVHLDESLATREPHESGWWSYDGSSFQPQPPWEAHRRPGG